jgi:hypothetical protein
MNTALWIGQGILALAMLYSGSCKATKREGWLVAHGQTGVQGLNAMLIRFIGVTELLGVVGIILPWWLGIASWLTPVTALLFALVMVLAAPIHYRLREPQNVGINLFLLLVCLFVAWGRWTSL